MHIFDNIGCFFTTNNNNDLVILNSLPGYNTLNNNHAGLTIPYLARNIIDNNNIEWEIGSATISQKDSAIVLVDRLIVSSSNNNNKVVFSSKGTKQFYLFVNSLNFNTGFNNVSIQNSNFSISNQKTVYIVDTTSGYIEASLSDPTVNTSLEVFFKVIGSGTLSIKYNNDSILSLSNDDYASVISTGKDWVILNTSNSNASSLSLNDSENVFLAQSQPGGDDRALQYNDGGSFAGSKIYIGNNNKTLFGSSSEDLAKHIVPSSGSFDTVINQTKESGNFIVYGSGNLPNYPSRNLIFTHDGRFGLNMPSGIKPATVFHIINNICHEDLRLENKSSCDVPAHIALYKNPYALNNADNTAIGKVSFSAKNSSGAKVSYASVEANTKSLANNDGQLNLVVSDGNTTKTTISTDPDSTVISNGLGKVEVSSSGSSISFDNSNIRVRGSNISIATTGTDTSIGVRASNITATGVVSVLTSLRLPYINQTEQLLCLDSFQRVIATTGFKIPGLGNQSSGKILTTTDGGTVVSQLNISDLWPYETGTVRIGGKDLSWNRFPSRSGQVCIGKTTKEIDLITPASVEEFAIGDQIAINNINNNTTIYNIVEDIFVTDDEITGLVLENSVNLSGDLSIFSITRGGILRNEIYTSGIASDATAIQLSTRPTVPTIFNTTKKNIDFSVYGVSDIPAINVFARASVNPRPSGKYFKYATQLEASDGSSIDPIPVKISVNGNGVGGSNNTVNYQEAAYSPGSVYWSGMASVVGTNGRKSFYGTYDQNGNVYEWIEDDQKISSVSSNQYVCGGSWRTSDSNGLRGYIPTPRLSGFDDVGFRICSKAGFSNSVINSGMQFRFTSVEDTNNLSDTSPLFTESFNNRYTIKAEPNPISKNALGSVQYSYSISETEITNKQYISFLNAVATGAVINGLYDPRMSGTVYGGILRSGNGSTTPFVYSAKDGMLNVPVVYVNYLSSLRFINWLNNSAPTGDLVNSSTTEDGSYYISESAGITSVTKKNNSAYWLPSLNEWHKAAYYLPLSNNLVEASGSAVTVNRFAPFEYASGQLSSLSVSGNFYTDSLTVGSSGSTALTANHSEDVYNVEFGGRDTIIETDPLSSITGTFGTSISNTGMVFATSGNTIFINKINPIGLTRMTPSGTEFYQPIFIGSGMGGGGIRISASGGLEYVSSSGTAVPGGMFPGSSGGFLFKVDDTNVVSSDYLKSESIVVSSIADDGGVSTTTGLYPVLQGTPENAIIHNSNQGYLSASNWFGIGLAPSQATNLGAYTVGIYKPSGNNPDGSPELPPALYTDRIFIGPLVNGFSGTILTHNGTGPALWKQPDYLSAPGVSWTRYPRRAIEFIGVGAGGDIDRFKFISLEESKGGTGPVDLQTIEEEFAYNETIAIYNQDREVFYVKVANISLVDARAADGSKDFFTNEPELIVTVCPKIPEGFYSESQLLLGEGDPDNGRYVGYSFSVQKGAYLEMKIEPEAIEGFTCDGLSTDSEYRFKPSTINTISIRPNIYTTFNKIAEDIDFIVYGHRKTLFTRYEPELFALNENGIPNGLVPAFRVHASVPNSVLGSLESGIFKKTSIVENQQIVRATGIQLDIKPKITINMQSPYVITSLTGVYEGIISYADSVEANLALEKEYGMEISVTGTLVSGVLPLSNYADLSVAGYTYSSGLITKEVVLSPVWSGAVPVPFEESLKNKLYVPNYPLTINTLGQIVSLIPPPNPELPGQPTNLVATPKYNSVVLEWQAPEKDGGKPIYAYLVEYYSDVAEDWLPLESEQITTGGLPLVSNAATYRYVGDLFSTTSYRFRVIAINTVGKSEPSDPTSPITPSSDVPSKPQALSVTRNQFDALISWTAPASDGLSTRDGYIIYYWLDDGTTPIGQFSWITYNGSVSPSATSLVIDNIPENNTYFFKIVAVNSYGSSEPSELRSVGTDGDPRSNEPTEPPSFGSDSFDFSGGLSGLGIMFTGVCY